MIERLPRRRGRRAQAKGNASSGKLYAVVSLAVGVVGIVIAAVSGASSSEYLSMNEYPCRLINTYSSGNPGVHARGAAAAPEPRPRQVSAHP